MAIAFKIDSNVLKKCIASQGIVHADAIKAACEIAQDALLGIVEAHGKTIKQLTDPYVASSYFLDYVEEALEDKGITEKVNSSSERFFGGKDSSDFCTAIQSGAIEYLDSVFKRNGF